MAAMKVLSEVLLAILAVVGFYGILRTLTASLLCPRQVVVAVVIREAVDTETLDILLDEAMRNPLRRRGAQVALFISRPLLDGRMGANGRLHPAYAEVAERYRAAVFAADMG